MTITECLVGLSIPAFYSHSFKKGTKPPYVAYLGNGQHQFKSDDTRYYHCNQYRVEYYFRNKNEEIENEIEEALLSGGFLFEKSEDVYVDSEEVFLIYYYVQ